MSMLLVTYDLNKEVVRPKIVDEIKKTEWVKLSESSYVIRTKETPLQVYERFKYLLDDNDDFFVITLTQPYAGFGPKDVVEWLDAALPRLS